jgi:hypothetical protein
MIYFAFLCKKTKILNIGMWQGMNRVCGCRAGSLIRMGLIKGATGLPWIAYEQGGGNEISLIVIFIRHGFYRSI